MDPQEKKQVFASPLSLSLFLGVIIIGTAERLLLADLRSEIQRSCKKLRFIPVKTKLSDFDQTSQELRMLSSVTINCQVTKIVMNSGSLSEL